MVGIFDVVLLLRSQPAAESNEYLEVAAAGRGIKRPSLPRPAGQCL